MIVSKFDSPTTNANPDTSLTFFGTQDTSVIKSSISCDKKNNITPLISCNQKEDDDIRANMMVLKSFLMNEVFDLRQEITSLQLQLQQEKLSKSKTYSCGNEEKIVIENLKSQITPYKTENNRCGNIKENIIKTRLHLGATNIDICCYFKQNFLKNLMYIVEQMIFQITSILLRKLRSW